VSLYCGWIKARQAARADADATARRLLERIEHDPYGFASTLTGDAVQVMHRDGLAAFERQVKARFEAIEPAQQASENAHRRDAAYLRRRWGGVLRAVYTRRRDVRAYVALCEQTELSAQDCLVVATMLRAKRHLNEALAWVDRGLAVDREPPHGSMARYDLAKLKRELLTKLGRRDDALKEAWTEFREHPSTFSYEELMRFVPKAEHRQGFFERPDLETVVAALPDYLRDFTRFAYLTGWRKGEIISLRWTDVDRDAGVIRLRPEAAKTGRGRMVILDGDLAELIDRRWGARLFTNDGNPGVSVFVFHRNGRPVGDFGKAWATACRAAGVPDKLFHDLRRTAARNMVRAGVPERVAMAITGHVTRSMFDRYNIVSEDDLRMAAQKTTMYVDTLPTTRSSL